MGQGWRLRNLWSLLVVVVLAGCGGTFGGESHLVLHQDAPTEQEDAIEPEEGLEVAPPLVLRGTENERPTPPRAPTISFQPAFHQALRWSHYVGSLTTFRLRIPVGRAGERLKITFRSGDGSLSLQKATVAHAGLYGELEGTPVPLTFSGSPGFTVGARTRVTSDPVRFPVTFRDELYVSFEVRGELAASAINAFPDSFTRSGAYASTTEGFGGTSWQRAIGVATIEVEGTTGRTFLAIGDSITEGYMEVFSDTRDAWPSLVETQLGLPVVNAGVSGQGFWGVREYLDQEVLALSGITDCIILLGTNDLGAVTDAEMQERMTSLLNRLQPFCRLWVSTLLPKEKTNYGSYEEVKAGRLAFNAWLRAQTRFQLIDLEAVTRQPGNVHLFIDGLEVDGIHPSPEGHRIMAAEVARVLRARGP
ncbi:MAG TPA: SGNH/GDSL hydrolase family protein [Myxococcaceae bacterium]|jgi:lysophospholipase L1-like esterase